MIISHLWGTNNSYLYVHTLYNTQNNNKQFKYIFVFMFNKSFTSKTLKLVKFGELFLAESIVRIFLRNI